MKRLLSVVLALGIVLLITAPCFAENFLDKLGRGLINTATGWGEYPKQIVETSKEHNAAIGASWGQAVGVSMAIERTGSGAYDIASFCLLPYDEPLLHPEYVFEF